jgi:putative ATP-dependent endonuclease of the OLD family
MLAMRITSVTIKNFRLLADVSLSLEERTTVVVGRNNSGKTSLTELFRRLLGDSPKFRLEDFSLSAHEAFWTSLQASQRGDPEKVIRAALPCIEAALTVTYDAAAPNIGALSDFVVDLNPDCTSALIVVRYELKPGGIEPLFKDIVADTNVSIETLRKAFFKEMRERIPKTFAVTVAARDPNDASNTRQLEFSSLRTLLHGGFINAQRGLDDETHRNRNVLGEILESLFRTASSTSADANDQAVVKKLTTAVQTVQDGIGEGFNAQLLDLLPAFALFGYPGFNDPALRTETDLNVEKLLTDHTIVTYAGVNGVNLPEAYNGLGTRNLIFILLKLLEFFKTFAAAERAPGIQLVFIEEPEVHLHPQMQEVFISKLEEIAAIFAAKFNKGVPWPVQFVVTTHSSHIANRASFNAIRYFTAFNVEPATAFRTTSIRDLRVGLGGAPKPDQDFLHKYLTLTRCDLFFADRAVLIEGTAERLLLPKMIEKVDESRPSGPHLGSQYLSVVEVGGAHAHLFFGLIGFLGLRTLVITDLDTVNGNDGGKACIVSDGTGTSNACIKSCFDSPPSLSVSDLIAKTAAEKTNLHRRLTYQIPETDGGPCGRTFEDAFILANPALFPMAGSTKRDKELAAQSAADKFEKKSDFALKYAIEVGTWQIPRYIAEGLDWLAGPPPPPGASAETAETGIG